MFQVKNTNLVLQHIDLRVRNNERMLTESYRDLIWKIYRRLLSKTPQWTGHAAANWNMGFGHPDNEIHDNSLRDEYDRSGDDGYDRYNTAAVSFTARQRGNMRAINKAIKRYGGEKGPWRKLVTRDTKVYFTNPVVGNDDMWKSEGTVMYMAEFQNPSWHSKLRAVNRPYETAAETLHYMGDLWKRRHGGKGVAVEGEAAYPEFV